jgi:hypothetical protein
MGGWVAKSLPKAHLCLLVGGRESDLRGNGWVGVRKRGGVRRWFGGSKIKLGLRWRRSICVARAHGGSIA